jgi:hypothetical protein
MIATSAEVEVAFIYVGHRSVRRRSSTLSAAGVHFEVGLFPKPPNRDQRFTLAF